MVEKIFLEEVIPAREYTSLVLHRGEILRVIDLEGKQVADLVAFNATDKGEKLRLQQFIKWYLEAHKGPYPLQQPGSSNVLYH